jgi:hypothetical protein
MDLKLPKLEVHLPKCLKLPKIDQKCLVLPKMLKILP